MMVRFATLCDIASCLKRSDEYSAWPSCRHCLRDVCPDHQVPGSATEDEDNLAVCTECALENQNETAV
jgi:hypothetical protein